jgi:hypothetical protein
MKLTSCKKLKLVPSINLTMPNLSEIDANIKNSSKAIRFISRRIRMAKI